MKRFFFFCLFLAIFCLTSCTRLSKIHLECSNHEDLSLTALNSSAKNDAITRPSKSSYLYYGFPEELCNIFRSSDFSTMPALEITLEVSDFTQALSQSVDADGKSIVPVFAYGLLRNNDFKSNVKLKNQLEERPLVRGPLTAFAGKRFSVSLALSADDLLTARGFAVYATAPVKLIRAEIKQASLGWNLDVNQVSNTIDKPTSAENSSSSVPVVGWYGFGPEGGALIFSEYNHTDFSSGANIFKGSLPPKITVALTDCKNDIGPYESQTRVKLTVGSESVSIRRAPSQTKVSLCCSALKDYYQPVYVTQNAQMVRSLVMEPTLPEPVLPVSTLTESALNTSVKNNGRVLTPIPCDPALLLSWDKNTWRTNDYELLCWEQFPNVLLFDVRDYAIQDSFFKRLAFFVEKKGFRGRLVTDEEVANIHGYNAHDYSATSLANFFETARQTGFSLNNYELLLRDILIANGLIIEENGKYLAGSGAVVSISQESATYLRSTFIAHENFHGIFFSDADFRSYVTQVFNEADPKSLEFLINYFTKTPTLNYDIEDQVLLENEFMAYLIQQSLSRVADYFAKNLAIRGSVIKDYPVLAKYVRDTKGTGFYESAKKLSYYLYDRWGLAAGRATLVDIE